MILPVRLDARTYTPMFVGTQATIINFQKFRPKIFQKKNQFFCFCLFSASRFQPLGKMMSKNDIPRGFGCSDIHPYVRWCPGYHNQLSKIVP